MMDSDSILLPSLLLFLAVHIASRRSVVVSSPLKYIPCSPSEQHRGSFYVKFLLDNDLIIPEPSEVLDVIYKEFASHPFQGKAQLAQSDTANSISSSMSGSSSDISPNPECQHTLLLTCNAVPALLSKIGLKEVRVSAAIKQAWARVDSGKLKL